MEVLYWNPIMHTKNDSVRWHTTSITNDKHFIIYASITITVDVTNFGENHSNIMYKLFNYHITNLS